jgi:pimeloyl-ACP methyl ester carboxylesterase
MGGSLRLGSQTLTRCSSAPLAYCGEMHVPLNYEVPTGPRIVIRYRFYPADGAAGVSQRTVVPVEGGPGYSTIGSVPTGYDAMYGGLLRRWNLLAVDNRGTGGSTPLYCSQLQEFSGATGGAAFNNAVKVCGTALNHRWRYSDGSWVHASELFGSAAAARDLASIIDALALPRIDLYGDSYGSYFAQVFAARYPKLVRSVILDSTYQVNGLNPWYPNTIRAMPTAFNVVCRRSPACASAASGASWSRLAKLAAALERSPLSGDVPSHTGDMADVSMNAVGLVDLLSDAAGDPEIYREIDAAARAYLDDHDPLPLLRLYDQRLASDEAYFDQPASAYSVELYLAVACTDYPQLFDMGAGIGMRTAQLARAYQSESGIFGPFKISDWVAQDQNTETYSACLDWPPPRIVRSAASAMMRLPASVPVLVLEGELDTWTPTSGAGAVETELGGRHRLIKLANATHVVGEGDTACGSELVRAFVANPSSIGHLNGACAQAVPAIHAVGSYPGRLAEITPITLVRRTKAPRPLLQLAAAAVATAGDAVGRLDAISSSSDRGLFGGSVTASPSGGTLTLHGDRLIPGVAVSGTVRLGEAHSPDAGQLVRATLTVAAPALPRATFRATWTTAGSGTLVAVSGSAGATRIIGTTPAP